MESIKLNPARMSLAAAFALSALAMAGCGSGYPAATTAVVPTLSARFYSIDGANNRLLQFSTDGKGSATETATVNLPSGLTPNLVATDASGNVYVGGYTTSVNTTEVLVYPANLSAPLRTVALEPGKLTALAVDSSGQIYAGQLNVLASVKVYAAAANGAAAALRTIAPSYLLYVNDVAVDGAGNVYVSAYNGGAYFIDEYTTSIATPLRTFYAPANSYFGGISVDSAGNVFALEQLTIVEFAAGSSGTPSPVQAINLPAAVAPYTAEAYSNVLRRDANGDFFVPLAMSNATASVSMVYAFAPAATGSATPILQFNAKDATLSAPLGTNIALAVN